MNFECRICGNIDNNQSYTVHEMMLGTGDKFTYFQCGSCGCLQISSFPENISEYYPENYYSYDTFCKLNKPRLFRSWIDKKRVENELYKPNMIGKLSNFISKPLDYIPFIKPANIQKNDAILDIGCGTGRLLQRMAMGGFSDLTGLDPYISQDITYDSGVHIIKQDITDFSSQTKKKFRLIMLHHSFEHMPNPHEVIYSLTSLLDKDGILLIRVPLVDSYAWRTYKENWVQLDAPRHFYLHTKKSMGLLFSKAGLKLETTLYDSSAFQIYGSEFYMHNISLSHAPKARKYFGKSKIKQFSQLARQLNEQQDGDQACFYLKRS